MGAEGQVVFSVSFSFSVRGRGGGGRAQGESPPTFRGGIFPVASRLFSHVMGPHSRPVCALLWLPVSSVVFRLLNRKSHSIILWDLAALPLCWGIQRGPSRLAQVQASRSLWASAFPSGDRVWSGGLH